MPEDGRSTSRLVRHKHQKNSQIDETNNRMDYFIQRKVANVLVDNTRCEEEASCAICLEPNDDLEELELPCRHAFCSSCLHCYNVATSTTLSCPLCRANLDENLYQYIYNNAVRLIRRAFEMSDNRTLRDHFSSIAKEEYQRLCKLYETASNVIHPVAPWLVRQVGVQLLQLEEKYDECIIKGEEWLTESASSGLDIGIRPIADTIRCIGLSQESLGRNKDALFSFRQIQDVVADVIDTDSVIDLKRQLLIDMCRIQFKNRQFTMAIHTGKMAIDINRHYDGVYEYIALAYKAKGRWKEAIATMECALRYEIPWDKRNHQRLKALYDELTQEASLIEK